MKKTLSVITLILALPFLVFAAVFSGNDPIYNLILFNTGTGGITASTTLSAYQSVNFGGTATSTFTATGALGIASSTPWGMLSIVGNTTPIFVVATSTAAGSLTPVFELDKDGHLITSGKKPSLGSTCGTSPSVTGNDYAGKITTGTAAPTSCTLTFANTYGTAPSCIIDGSGPTNVKIGGNFMSSTTATTLNIMASSTTAFAGMTSWIISYQCIGLQ